MVFNITLIFGCQLAGETLVRLIDLPLPGPVVGMALLFAGLLLFGLPEGLAKTGDVLLGNLSLLFVPAGVGVMLHAGLLARNWPAISAGLVLSTLLTIAVTGLLMQRLGRHTDGNPTGTRND